MPRPGITLQKLPPEGLQDLIVPQKAPARTCDEPRRLLTSKPFGDNSGIGKLQKTDDKIDVLGEVKNSKIFRLLPILPFRLRIFNNLQLMKFCGFLVSVFTKIFFPASYYALQVSFQFFVKPDRT
jgi:hypothetical protein